MGNDTCEQPFFDCPEHGKMTGFYLGPGLRGETEGYACPKCYVEPDYFEFGARLIVNQSGVGPSSQC